MAATPINVATIDRSGLAAPAEDAMDIANGNVLANNNGRIWIEVTNTGGTTKNLTVSLPGQDGVASPGKVYALATTVKRRLGPFPVGVYGTAPLFQAEAGSTLTIKGWQLSA